MHIKLALIAATTALGTFTFDLPAQAISIGSSYSIESGAFFTDTSIDFADPGVAIVTAASGDFSPVAPGSTIIGGFPLSINLQVLTNDFDFSAPTPFLLVDFVDAFNDFDFFVTSASFDSSTLRYFFNGKFGDGTPGIGEIARTTLVPRGDGSFGYAGTFQAIPTPALLPGLIGMGVAALRRKTNQTENETA